MTSEYKAFSGVSERIPASLAHLYHEGVAKMIDFNKFALDLYAHHAVDILNSWKRIVSPPPPAVLMIDMATQGIQQFVGLQKKMLDIAVRQTDAAVAPVIEQSVAAPQGSAIAPPK